MKKKTDPRVDAYIARSAEFAQPVLRRLRKLVHQGCPDVEETIKWSMPSFTYHGILCGMAAFKAHCTFGFWHQGMKTIVKKAGGKSESAMGQFGRITSLDDLPDDSAMLQLIKEAVKLNASGKPIHPPSKPRPELPVPDYFVAVLNKNKIAAAVFQKFSPSNRRDYIEWLTEAKRDETRQARLETAITWIAAGKSRNWKYMKC